VARIPAEPALRWAALLHDLGKSASRTQGPDGNVHFYGHEAHSCRLAAGLLGRLKASRALMDRVLALVRHHGQRPSFEWGDAACRRLLARLQKDGLPLEDWAALRKADLQGRREPSEEDLQAFQASLERLQRLAEARPALSARELALDGLELMALLGRSGGPWLGRLQAHLLECVLEDPARNSPEALGPLAKAWAEEARGE
jgi:CRISPR/Cas system-associated endonuclease Cas3-HD